MFGFDLQNCEQKKNPSFTRKSGFFLLLPSNCTAIGTSDRQKKPSPRNFEVQTIAIRSEFKTVEPQTQTQVFGGISHSKTDTDTNVRHNRFTVLTHKRTKFDTRISKFSHRKIVFFGRCRPSLRTNSIKICRYCLRWLSLPHVSVLISVAMVNVDAPMLSQRLLA